MTTKAAKKLPPLPEVKDPGIYAYRVKPERPGDKGIRYRVVYQTPEGKQSQKRGFERLEDARTFKANNKVRIDAGEYVAPSKGRITVGELAPDWLKAKKAANKKSSYTANEGSWRLHVKPRWENVKVSAITSDAVEAWITDLLLEAQERAEKAKARGGKVSDGASLIRQAHTTLVGILDLAKKRGAIKGNPARGIDGVPKLTKKRHVYLTNDDVQRLAKEAGQHRTLVLVLAYCGLRWGEAVALRVRDVDATRGRLIVSENAVQLSDGIEVGTTKSDKWRTVPVPLFVMVELKKRTKGKLGDALLFPHPGDPDEYLPRSKHGDGWFAGAVKRAKIQRVTPHDLRHTCASLAVSAGANVLALARMLGHSDPSITLKTYADLFDTDLDRVAVAMDKAYSPAPCQNLAKAENAETKAA
ncbi:tyrosine-type recombinase/integrase [Nocardia sp. ET3-3]|uniref:Tyrosine-type recombinase/integrase n=1 Tax=Nocardia terrae TaxID=2675851 RepID=A0A7K1VAL7_9NOCA|nr:site-specific integrase [Nocardia terrae]MVU83462.1 tyrosine-type recombinase/integrase [Nocardia terrae]